MKNDHHSKVMLLGLDALSPVLMHRLIEEGVMPNLASLIEEGVYGEALAPVPGLTHPNWVSIATGAFPSTHGVTCHTVHYPGESLDIVHNAYTSEFCKAEFLWNTAEKVGKRSILMKYLCSWPPTIKDGIQVGGHGNPEGPSGPMISLSGSFSTDPTHGRRIELRTCAGWNNLPTDIMDPKEGLLKFSPKHGEVDQLRILVARRNSDTYNTLIVSRDKDLATKLCEIYTGEWSDWIKVGVTGWTETDEGAVRFKLQELSPDGEFIRLFCTGIQPLSGFTYPESIAEELLQSIGPFYDAQTVSEDDPETRQQAIAYQADWIAEATTYLMNKYSWDLYFLQWWWTDITGHSYLHLVDPIEPNYDKEIGEKNWEYLKKEFEICDKMLGKLFRNADEDTAIFVISDHGMLNGRTVLINSALRNAGLITLKQDAEGRPVVDWSKTQAFAQRSVYIYVNLKGRDPDGTVEPGEEYERVRAKVMEVLYNIREPDTGRRAVSLALKREEAGILGVHNNESVGDIVYVMAEGFGNMFAFEADEIYGRDYKGFGSTADWRLTEDIFVGDTWALHGSQIPGLTYGLSSEKAIFIMKGPGIKKGYTLSSPIWIIDAAPTIATFIDIPVPAQAEGRTIYEAFEG